MQIACAKTDLHSAIQHLSSILDSRSPHLILHDILLEAEEDGKVSLTATDTQITAKHTLTDCEVQVAGKTLVPIRSIGPAVRDTPSSKLELLQEEGNSQLTLKDDTGTIRIPTSSPEQYPPIPTNLDKKWTLLVDTEKLTRALQWTIFTTAIPALQPILGGICFDIGNIEKKELTLYASDNMRLSIVHIPVQSIETEVETENAQIRVIVPLKAAQHLQSMLKNALQIEISLSENELSASTEQDFLCARLIIGRYPVFNTELEKEKKYPVTFNTEALSQALRRVSILFDDEYDYPSIDITPKQTTISADNPQAGQAKIIIPAEYDGPPTNLTTHISFLTDILHIWKEETITFHVGEPNDPFIVKEGKEFFHLAVPEGRNESEESDESTEKDAESESTTGDAEL